MGWGALTAAAMAPVSAGATNRYCGERAKLVKFLQGKYSERPRAVGVSGSGKAVMEVYTSEKGSWTLLMTMTNGKTCIMAAGHSWEDSDKLAYLPKS